MAYCIINTTSYNGDYTLGGTYNGQDYYQGPGGFIFSSNTENRWCLAANLGDPCVQFGPYGSSSTTPDLDVTVMYAGLCVTTTTTTDPCLTFDFNAVFDCLVPPTPSITPTPTVTPTNTPTPTPSSPCGGRAMTVTMNSVSATPTPTPTITPSSTPQVTRPCNFSGEVIFNSFSEILQCANSKRFTDCFSGVHYYTSDLVLISGATPSEDYVYFGSANGQQACLVFDGLFENISGVDNITLSSEIGSKIDGSCLDCLSNIQPTTTTTTSTSTTTTTTTLPCVNNAYSITNLNPVSYINPNNLNIKVTDCVNGQSSIIVAAGATQIVCSSTYPISDNPQNTTITLLPSICL